MLSEASAILSVASLWFPSQGSAWFPKWRYKLQGAPKDHSNWSNGLSLPHIIP